MYLGLPIIAFGVSYNRVTTEHKAIYFDNLEELISEINKIYTVKLKKIGTEMKKIAQRRYTWTHIVFKYDLLIQEALEANQKLQVEAAAKRIPYQQLLEMGHAHLKTNYNF